MYQKHFIPNPPSLSLELGRRLVRWYMAPAFSAKTPVAVSRMALSAISAAARIPKGTRVEKISMSGVGAQVVCGPGVEKEQAGAILYFHGGGFFCGSPKTHREMAARISKASGLPVFLPDYRLAPERPYPAANFDCLAAWDWMINKRKTDPGGIVLGGDSAGGCLVLMTLLTLKERGGPMPAGAFLFSPLADAAIFDGESLETRRQADPWFCPDDIPKHMSHFTGCLDAVPPILSPLRADLSGLPPLFVQAGDCEIFLSDSVRLAQNAATAGVDVVLEVWENLWHVFQSFGTVIPHARRAIRHTGDFVNRCLEQRAKQTLSRSKAGFKTGLGPQKTAGGR
jgi:acetyl esterase/lipase